MAFELTRDPPGIPDSELASRLFYDHATRVQRYVRRHHPNVDADDVVSETFVIAWRRASEIESDREVAWLIGVARNVVRNTTRSARRRHQYTEALISARPRISIDFADAVLLSEDLEPFRTAFAHLSTDDQEILLLAAWEDLSGSDLGTALDISAERANDRLYRARKRLRARLPQHQEEP